MAHSGGVSTLWTPKTLFMSRVKGSVSKPVMSRDRMKGTIGWIPWEHRYPSSMGPSMPLWRFTGSQSNGRK